MVRPQIPPERLPTELTDVDPTQSSEARLYVFSQETKAALRKFRLGTSRASEPQAVICTYVSCASLTPRVQSSSASPPA